MRALPLLVLLAALLACSGPVARVGRAPAAGGAPSLAGPLCEAVLRAGPYSAEGSAAVAALLRAWVRPGPSSERSLDGCRVAFDATSPHTFAPDYFDAWAPAADLTVEDLPRQLRAGVGVPLVCLRHNRESDALERHYPPEAITRAVTALARARRDPDGRVALELRLVSSLSVETVRDGERELPLAADFTAPFATLLQRAGPLQRSWLREMTAAKPPREPRLYLMEPYDPDKQPLIMIHGLLSTPIVWAQLTNELWGTPEVRRRYQIWHFLYPTGAPFLYPARSLRRQLDEVRALLAERTPGPAPQLVLLAHSMGGLLARTLVTTSGEGVWRTVFAVPATALRGNRDDVARVNDILHWNARDDVARVIFLAVPHRGSDLADRASFRFAGAFAGVPGDLSRLYRRVAAVNPGALDSHFARSLAAGKLSSVNTLSPQHPVLRVMSDLPFRAGLHVHSIVGDRGEIGPEQASSDGVVPYWSSHLASAESELIVPAAHRVFAHPLAVREIVRILDEGADPAK